MKSFNKPISPSDSGSSPSSKETSSLLFSDSIILKESFCKTYLALTSFFEPFSLEYSTNSGLILTASLVLV